MLGIAIAEGLFAKQNSLLVSSQTRKLFLSLLKRGKLTGINSHRDIVVGVRAGNACYCRGGNLKSSVVQTRGLAADIKPYDVETNLPKDVLLYRYENPKYFKRLNYFAISQLLFWTYLAHFVFTELRDVPVNKGKNEDLPWWGRINLGQSLHRKILTILVFLVGYSLFGLSWMHILKSVRYLVLRKGGKEVTFVTYTPFGENRFRTVPLEKMTSKESRTAAKVQLPIKVKGDMMHYLLDMRGEFRHPKLFDFTAGLRRTI